MTRDQIKKLEAESHERVVIGKKAFSYVKKDGERVEVKPGEKITVNGLQARAFKDRLIAPEVLKRQQEATEATSDPEEPKDPEEGSEGSGEEGKSEGEEGKSEATETPKTPSGHPLQS